MRFSCKLVGIHIRKAVRFPIQNKINSGKKLPLPEMHMVVSSQNPHQPCKDISTHHRLLRENGNLKLKQKQKEIHIISNPLDFSKKIIVLS